MTVTIILVGCAIAVYFFFKNRAKTYVLNLKRVGLAAAHTYIITGDPDALTAVVAVKSVLRTADGEHLVNLIGKLPDISEQAQLARQLDISRLLANRSLDLTEQIRCKSELRKSGSRWSVAVEKANFDIASDILLRVLH